MEAYNYMCELIQDGYEFSVAHEKAINKFKLTHDQGRELINIYDEDN